MISCLRLMLVLAHFQHWLFSVLYALPVLALVGAIWFAGRRLGPEDAELDDEQSDEDAWLDDKSEV